MKQELKDLISFFKQQLNIEVFTEIPTKPTLPVCVLEILQSEAKTSKTQDYARSLTIALNFATKKYSDLHEFEQKVLNAIANSEKFYFHNLTFAFKQENDLFFLTAQMKVFAKRR